jgi:O-antigen/teichoic acid export membrane protein
VRLRDVGLAAGVALAVALPAALVAQLLDALSDEDDLPVLAYPLVAVVLGAMVLGGMAVGRRAGGGASVNAALGALGAIVLVEGLGILRRVAADEDVAWGTVPVVVVIAVGLGILGARLGARRPGRTRP